MKGAKIKALCLLSGGLDSSLAAKVVRDQGIEVIGVNFIGPFLASGDQVKASAAAAVARSIGIDLRVIALGEDYLEVIRNPRHGYGSNLNPCIDCRIYMLKKVKEMMSQEDASFIVTGEVLGQRPMSQRKDTMRKIEKESGLEGLLLRPLSALALAPTIPESKGWVSRESMLSITGRSRREQMRLAKERKVDGYSSPGGGCLLTDPHFAPRVKDLIDHAMLTEYHIGLLKVGRHFRLPRGSKLIVGRNMVENQVLQSEVRDPDLLMITEDCPGPTAILAGSDASQEWGLGAGIVARYSDGRQGGLVKVRIRSADGEAVEDIKPLSPAKVAQLMI